MTKAITEKRNFAKVGSFMTQAQAKNSWVHYADAGTTLEDVQRPNYWCNVAGRMLLYDRVEVVFPELNAIADFVVLGIEDVTKCLTPNRAAQSAKLKLMNAVNFSKDQEDKLVNSDYSVRYINPAKRYGIFNHLNNSCVEDSIQTKEEAQEKMGTLIALNT